MAVDERAAIPGARRILADYQGDAAVCIHVIGAGLRIVFKDEESRVVPERRVGDRFNSAADGEIVVGD